MRRSQRLITAGVLFALCSVLAGCGGGGLSSFDPTDMLDFLDTKKKLPGNRQPVFPEGVPGLDQGVPKDLYKGSPEMRAQEDQLNGVPPPQQQAVAAPPEEPKAPPPKARAKARHAAKPKAAPAEPDAAPAGQDAAPAGDEAPAATPPAPKPKRAHRSTTVPPPDQPPAQPAPAQQSQSAFPAPLPSGSFSR